MSVYEAQNICQKQANKQTGKYRSQLKTHKLIKGKQMVLEACYTPSFVMLISTQKNV
jgi:hypothetical protein